MKFEPAREKAIQKKEALKKDIWDRKAIALNEINALGSVEWATQELFKMVKEPTYRPVGLTQWSIWPEIKNWANTQLPTGWANARTQKKTLDRIYGYWAEQMGVTDREEIERKIRVIDRNLISMHNLNMALAVVKKKDFNDIVTNEEGRDLLWDELVERKIINEEGVVGLNFRIISENAEKEICAS